MNLAGYRASLASAMQVPRELFDRPGLTVVAGDDRRGERLASHYVVGDHAVLWVDPDIAADVAGLADDHRTPRPDVVRAWMLARGATVLGSGVEHLLPAGVDLPVRDHAIRMLDGADPAVRDLVADLQSECSADDLEQADFDLDRLDPFLAGWVDDDRLAALAGGRENAGRPGFTDVGVLVHPGHRRRGLGRAVIAAVVCDVLAAGEEPLYRCSVDNDGSRRLCRGLGFDQVLWLEAFRWPTADVAARRDDR